MKHEYQRQLFIECHKGWMYWWETLMFIDQECNFDLNDSQFIH
jgi:hypothetical protein